MLAVPTAVTRDEHERNVVVGEPLGDLGAEASAQIDVEDREIESGLADRRQGSFDGRLDLAAT